MKINANTITNCKVGNIQVKEIRIGNALIWSDIITPTITAFKTRATSLNCIFEGESCLFSTLSNLNNDNFIEIITTNSPTILISNLKARSSYQNSIFEGESCLITTLNNLNI